MLITVSCTGYQTENSRVYTSIYIFMTVTHGKGGLQNEENLSAEEAPQNEGARISQENVYSQWPQGACPPQSQGKTDPHLLIAVKEYSANDGRTFRPPLKDHPDTFLYIGCKISAAPDHGSGMHGTDVGIWSPVSSI